MANKIEEILPYYLGTGLKVQRGNKSYLLSAFNTRWNTLKYVDNVGDDYNTAIQNVKPMLRSLSNLTEPITVEGYNDGKPFVPMIEILILKERNTFSKDDLVRSISEKNQPKIIDCKTKAYSTGAIEHIVRHVIETTNMGTLIYSLKYDEQFDRFSYRDETREIVLGVGYQLQLFQMLFKWHFNVFNLTTDQFVEIEEVSNG